MKKHCYALDLINDPDLISEYEFWHKSENGWPEIRKSIISSGVTDMQIYRTGNRLFMIMETDDNFRHEDKKIQDEANPVVQQWEQLMWKFQQPLPWAVGNEKWVLMEQIFGL